MLYEHVTMSVDDYLKRAQNLWAFSRLYRELVSHVTATIVHSALKHGECYILLHLCG